MRYLLRRLSHALFLLAGVSILAFLFTALAPGTYFDEMRLNPQIAPETVTALRAQYGFDKPLPVQFLRYVGDLSHGDLGASLTTGQPVATEIRTRLPASAELTLLGLILAMAVAVPLGILAAMRPGSLVDHACRIFATAGVSLPVFFTGLILVYVFYYLLGWAPAPLVIRLQAVSSAAPIAGSSAARVRASRIESASRRPSSPWASATRCAASATSPSATCRR